MKTINVIKFIAAATLAMSLMFPIVSRTVQAAEQIDIAGPAGSGRFGIVVRALPNGNIVVSDTLYDITTPTPIADVGAVYLYNGATGALISRITGSTASDRIGGDLTVLSNGNFVVSSPLWRNGAASSAGAVTWGSAATGISGVISASNSLVGSRTNDRVGTDGVTLLTNGNYLVRSSDWDNGTAADAGAVTWGSGVSGVSGVVSAANSLVGSRAGDEVGTNTFSEGTAALTNGNYVVNSPRWDNGTLDRAGAVTWGNGATGTSGVISAANSLVGSTAGDQIGLNGVDPLPNGNYIIRSSLRDNGTAANAGAVTWGSGTSGIAGTVSTANSLVGSSADDRVGESTRTLSNGNYVVSSQFWNNGAATDVGAVTWGSSAGGTVGAVSAANSLVGSSANDQVGSEGIVPLTNGNYVVVSPFWDNGATPDVGAVTWGSGTGGTVGAVSPANSLVGSSASDQVGRSSVTALTNGNYVAKSPFWDNGTTQNVGAVTWGSGTSGITGAVSTANSLYGSTTADSVGSGIASVTALTNGNYVVSSLNWNDGAVVDAGAVTWGNGASGITGAVSASNSLVGSQTNDIVGEFGATALTNGNYVTRSSLWNNGAVADAGAVTWGNGAGGTVGVVSSANSIVGSSANDQIGFDSLTPLTNGNYVVHSLFWDNGAATDAGAVTFGSATGGTVGAITADNSVRGVTASGGELLKFAFDATNNQLIVGRSFDNIVTLFRQEPSAAAAIIGGRVFAENGRGLRNATVTLTEQNGETRITRTTQFGYYRFDDIPVGQTIVIGIRSKRYQFAPQVLAVTGTTEQLDFTPQR